MRCSVVSLLDAHRRFLESAVETLSHDPRVAAVVLTGSAGRGEEDEWSDLDINVVADDDAAPQLLGTPDQAELFGDLITWVDCSFNAGPSGSMTFARYASPEGLVLVDWHVWPRTPARLTQGAKLLWARPAFELAPFEGNLVDLVLSGERRRIAPYSRQQRAEWELCMTHIATARPPRQRDGRDLHRLIGLDEDTGPEPDRQLDGLERHLDELEPLIAPRAMRATRERIEAARRALGR